MHSSPQFPHVQNAQEKEAPSVQMDLSGAWFLAGAFAIILTVVWITMSVNVAAKQKERELQLENKQEIRRTSPE